MLAVRLTLDVPVEGVEGEEEDCKGVPVVATPLSCNGRARLKLGLFKS